MATTKVGFSDLLTEWLSEVPMPPTDEIGYGSDLYCYDDIRETGQTVDGLNALAQNIYRRISTDRGSVIGSPNYGLDIRSFLHRGLDPTTLIAVPALIELEVKKDVRVQKCTVTVLSRTDASIKLRITVQAITETGVAGQFDLTVNVTKAGVELAGLEVNT